jgi:peptidoglycan/xylan/chitin deacetylase (PgdA/CDA1 family)
VSYPDYREEETMKTVRVDIVVALLTLLIVSSAPAHGQQPGSFRVYLTFEDGPTESYTPTLLDILAQYNAKATFFVTVADLAGRRSCSSIRGQPAIPGSRVAGAEMTPREVGTAH